MNIAENAQDVVSAFMSLDSDNPERQSQATSTLMTKSLPQVVYALSKATGEPEQKFKELDDLNVIVDLIEAVIEVNDFLALVTSTKEKVARLSQSSKD